MSDSLIWDLTPCPDSNAFICSYYVKMKILGDGQTIKLSYGGISSWLVAKGDNCVRVGMDRKKEEVTSLEKVA